MNKMRGPSKPLRIGLDARVFSDNRYSGIPRAVYEIIRVWARDYPENEYFLVSSVPIHLDLDLPPNWKLVIGPTWVRRQQLWSVFFFLPVVKKLKLDVFWGTNYVLPGRIRGTRQIVTVYDFAWYMMPEVSGRSNWLRLKLFAKRSCDIADCVVAISKATARDAIRIFKVPRSRIAVSYCGGLSDSQLQSARDQTAGEQSGDGPGKHITDHPFFLFISTIEPRKNVETIIHAYEHFRNRSKKQIDLVLAGRRGWNCENIYKAVENSPYRDSIKMPGFVTDEERSWLLGHAIAFLYPSLYEGFGIPILEAYAYGLPVITSNISSMPEVGKDAAFYIQNTDDAKELAVQMRRVADLDGDEKRLMREKQQRVLASFSWKKNADEMMKLMQRGEG